MPSLAFMAFFLPFLPSLFFLETHGACETGRALSGTGPKEHLGVSVHVEVF